MVNIRRDARHRFHATGGKAVSSTSEVTLDNKIEYKGGGLEPTYVEVVVNKSLGTATNTLTVKLENCATSGGTFVEVAKMVAKESELASPEMDYRFFLPIPVVNQNWFQVKVTSSASVSGLKISGWIVPEAVKRIHDAAAANRGKLAFAAEGKSSS